MVTNMLNLTDNYTTTRYKMNNVFNLKVLVDGKEEILPIYCNESIPKQTYINMNCSMLAPLVIVGAGVAHDSFTGNPLGWSNLVLPYVMSFCIELGRIVFYCSGSKSIFLITKGEMRSGIEGLKNAGMGYGLLLSLETIMKLIELMVQATESSMIGG